MGKKYKPEDVFTPKTVVTRDMFEKRNEKDLQGRTGLQDTLRNALRERGGQVLLFGETGVGKSSLLKYAAADEHLGLISLSCKTSHTHEGILEALVRKLVTVEKIQTTKSKSVASEAGVEAAVPWFAKVVGKISVAGGETADFKVVQKSALDVIRIALEKSDRSLIVLDNFQNVRDADTRSLIAQTMEELSDQAGDEDDADIKCVVIGIADDAAKLLGSSKSFERRTTQIGVPRMPDEEIGAILKRGFETLLKIELPTEVREQLVFFSDGFPYFAHVLGLHVARAARAAGASSVDMSMVDSALDTAALSVASTYTERLIKAYEAGGDVQPRKQIMKLLSNSNKRSWGSPDVQSLWEKDIGVRDDYAFMHTALAQLSQPKYGNVLVRTGTATKYRYRFDDPHMRPFLRITDGGASLPALD